MMQVLWCSYQDFADTQLSYLWNLAMSTTDVSVRCSPILNVTFLFFPLLYHVFDTHNLFSR